MSDLRKLENSVNFRIVAMRQDLGVVKVNKLLKGIVVHQVRVPYLLGEDVNYQLTENARVGNKPVILVKHDAVGGPYAMALSTHDGLARNVLVALVSGKLDAIVTRLEQ